MVFGDYELSYEEAGRLAEKECRANLGISFLEFKEKWLRGDYQDDPRPEVTNVAFWLGGWDEEELYCD